MTPAEALAELEAEVVRPHAESMPASVARAEFMDVVSRARFGGQATLITNKGKPAAAVISARDLERLLRLRQLAEEASRTDSTSHAVRVALDGLVREAREVEAR
ncbi:type II toxin-antitoxin system prevent-host-death family antitoxin [Deinococcus sp. A31D244]|uniref:type II toxin-antitoxin system prevent-host-death family antitoxin n=1 Tax=Deinococcus sp. A31D244 TaxID=3397675 RepID=UPI0039E17D31